MIFSNDWLTKRKQLYLMREHCLHNRKCLGESNPLTADAGGIRHLTMRQQYCPTQVPFNFFLCCMTMHWKGLHKSKMLSNRWCSLNALYFGTHGPCSPSQELTEAEDIYCDKKEAQKRIWIRVLEDIGQYRKQYCNTLHWGLHSWHLVLRPAVVV